MRAGRLDRRITLQRRALAENSMGEAIPSWHTIATVWAEKVPLRGAERYAAQQVVAEAETKYRIRYRAGITPVDRILDEDGKACDVISVLEIGRRVGLEIIAKKRAE